MPTLISNALQLTEASEVARDPPADLPFVKVFP
jgi:hypothetical protein